jgi:glycyl-tRNA synthetase alpha subunit
MAERVDPKELVTFKELLMSEVIQSEAMINLLDRKGIISKTELMGEIKRVQAALPKSEMVKL